MARRPEHVRGVARLVREGWAVEHAERVDLRGGIEVANALNRLAGQEPEHRVVEAAGVKALHVRGRADGEALDVLAPVLLAQAQAGKFCRAVEAAAIPFETRRVEQVDPASVGKVEADPSHARRPKRAAVHIRRHVVAPGLIAIVAPASRRRRAAACDSHPPELADGVVASLWHDPSKTLDLCVEWMVHRNSPKQVKRAVGGRSNHVCKGIQG